MKRVVRMLCAVGIIAILTGCVGLNKRIPQAGMQVDIGSMDRNHYVVLDLVDGESTRTSICGGLIQFVDGNKLVICNMRFFADEFSQEPIMQERSFSERLMDYLTLPTVQQRAYYKSLAATPDADVIIPKAYDYESSGIPVIFTHEKVNFRGKAIKLKTDKELK